MSNIARSLVFAAALVAGTAPLAAQEVRTMTVDFRDLNLASATGQKTLARRIARATQTVCEQPGRDLATRSEAQACRVAAVRRAQADLAKAGVPVT